MRERLQHLRTPLRIPEFRSLATAHVVSGLGDWAGRLALSVVVYERSDSALWAALVTAVSLVPWLGIGQMLATLADRYGRVRVMIVSDLLRAYLFLAMALTTSVPLLLLAAFAAGMCVPPFAGAQSAALVEVTDDTTYPGALGLIGVISQFEVLAGYAGGGLLIATIGPRPALAANALTFLVSAVALSRLQRGAASTRDPDSQLGWAGVRAGARFWRRDPISARALLLFVGTSMFAILPETLVVPFADDIGISDRYIGILAALIAVGSLVGITLAPSKGTPEQLLRNTALRGCCAAVASGALYAVSPLAVAAAGAYAVSGMVEAIGVPTNQVVGPRLPTSGRAAAMTVAAGTQNITQVLAITVAGIVATFVDTRWVLAVAMLAAAVVCIWAVVRPIASQERSPQVASPA